MLVGALDPASLATAYPWPDGAWLRLAMLRCLDGGVAGADGRSRSVSSDADRLVLGEIRRLADAVLTGAGTMRTEPYGPFRVPTGEPTVGERAALGTAAERAALGLDVAPRLVVVSGSLDLPWDAPVFAESARPVVVVTSVGAAGLAEASRHADVVALPALEPAAVVAALHERGLRRLVCEGGPRLADSFARAGLLDEVDLTLAPSLPSVGAPTRGAGSMGALGRGAGSLGAPGRGAGSLGAPGRGAEARETAAADVVPQSFALQHVLSHGDHLFLRYLRRA